MKALLVLAALSLLGQSKDYFLIQVVDADTGRPVPLVELRTVNDIRYYTDSNGLVAFNEPGLMNRTVFFFVSSHGYEYPKDGFGFRGVRLKTVPGTTAVIQLPRKQIAQRLYRITGQGIYNYTVLAGLPAPLKRPVLNGKVLGQDSVLTAQFHGKLYWFWGDTNRPEYPLGNFHTPGATSLLPKDGGLDPDVGVDLKYFLDENGFVKPTCPMPGPGPTWIGGLTVLRDGSGRERMFASYSKIKAGTLQAYERGVVEFDDDAKVFRKVRTLPVELRRIPAGHALQVRDSLDRQWVYFATPYPLVRVRASVEAFLDPEQYEAFTPLKPGSAELDRDERGQVRWSWKKGADPLTPNELLKRIRAGQLRAEQVPLQLHDKTTGKGVLAHAGSVYWNEYRRRYVMITTELFGSSVLGEVWYAEADTPIGPWCYAVKVVTHNKYSFYNPKHHPYFDKDGGRVIYFEGTYTTFISGAPFPTPRYNYNQIMYKLELDDPRVALPVPVYDVSPGKSQTRFQTGLPAGVDDPGSRIAFWAPDRPFPGAVAVVATEGGGLRVEEATGADKVDAVFFALRTPPEGESPIVPLYEYRAGSGAPPRYSISANEHWPDYERAPQPLCYVWRSYYDTSLLDEALGEWNRRNLSGREPGDPATDPEPGATDSGVVGYR